MLLLYSRVFDTTVTDKAASNQELSDKKSCMEDKLRGGGEK